MHSVAHASQLFRAASQQRLCYYNYVDFTIFDSGENVWLQGKISESSAIRQIKTIQISSYN